MRRGIYISSILFAWTACGQGADPDPLELMRKSAQADKANGEKESQYAYREYKVTRQIDKNGKETDRETETWDVIGLEGSSYRRLVLKNDKALPPKDERREAERLQKETDRRKRESPEARRNRLFSLSYSFSFPYDKVADLDDLRYAGEETVAGRRAWVVEGYPKPGLRPAGDQEREALNYRMKTWIDQEDYMCSRLELEVITDHSRMQKGSVIRVENFKSNDGNDGNDGVWLARQAAIDYDIRFFKLMGVRGSILSTYSDYHKFQVDSRIIEAGEK